MTESRIWAGGLLAILLLALLCTWVHYVPEAATTSAIQAGPSSGSINNMARTGLPAPELNLRSESSAGMVILSGDVPSEADRIAIVERATRIYGVGKVVDNLKLDPAGRPDGFDAFAAQFPLDLRDSVNTLAYAQTGRLVIEGQVSSDNAKAGIEASAIKSFAPRFKIDSRLIVKSPGKAATEPLATTTPAPIPGSAPKPQIESASAGKSFPAIKFSTASANLSKKARLDLRQMAGELRSLDPATRIALVGFTDSRGSDQANLTLSERRAASVKAYLTKLGVGVERLSTEARGPADPVGENSTIDGRRENRRVEVRLL